MKCVSSPQTNSESRLYPSATSHLNPNHLSYFEFLGRLLGKAVYEVRPRHGPHSPVVQCGAQHSRLVHTVHTHLHCTPVSCVRMHVCMCACCGRTCSSITKLASLPHLIFLQHSSTPSSQCLSPSSAFHPLPPPQGIVVDVPFARFFVSQLLGHQRQALYSPYDELPFLDPDLYRSLQSVKVHRGRGRQTGGRGRQTGGRGRQTGGRGGKGGGEGREEGREGRRGTMHACTAYMATVCQCFVSTHSHRTTTVMSLISV